MIAIVCCVSLRERNSMVASMYFPRAYISAHVVLIPSHQTGRSASDFMYSPAAFNVIGPDTSVGGHSPSWVRTSRLMYSMQVDTLRQAPLAGGKLKVRVVRPPPYPTYGSCSLFDFATYGSVRHRNRGTTSGWEYLKRVIIVDGTGDITRRATTREGKMDGNGLTFSITLFARLSRGTRCLLQLHPTPLKVCKIPQKPPVGWAPYSRAWARKPPGSPLTHPIGTWHDWAGRQSQRSTVAVGWA